MNKPKTCILLVDDDPNLRLTLGDILEAKGFDAYITERGSQALELATEKDMAVAMIDLRIGDLPGLEVLRGIKTSSPTTECIVLTGFASQDSAIEAINLGAYSYIQKPFDVDHLLLTIQHAIQKRATEQALRESEERFRSLFENSTIGLYRTTPEGEILLANPTLVHMLGFSSYKELSQRNLEKDGYAPEYSRNQFRQRVEQEGEVKGLESAWTRKDGSLIYLRESAKAIYDPDGRVLYYEGTVEDISERKKAEGELRIAEDKYRHIFENSIEGIFQSTPEGIFITANPALAKMFGYNTPEDLIAHATNLNKQFYVDPNRRQEFIRLMETQQSVMGFESQIYCQDGSRMWVSENAHVVRDENGGFLYYEGTALNITQRKQAEAALRENEFRYRTITENMSDTVWLMDLGFQTIWISPSVTRTRGYTLEELQSLTLDQQMTPDSLQRTQALIIRELTPERIADKNCEISASGEFEFYRKDGSAFWSDIVMTLMRDANGNPSGFLGVGRDITTRKRAEDLIRASLAEKEVLLKEIHHRVKNNLAIISSLLDLQARASQDERVKAAFKDSQQRIQAMAEIHEQLYRSQNFTKIDMSRYCQSLAKGLLAWDILSDVTIQVEVEEVWLDIDHAIPCGLIISELVTNAINHAFSAPSDPLEVGRQQTDARQKKLIQLRMTRNPDTCTLRISDNGIGLPDELDVGSTNTLGLKLVNRLACQLGGSLESESSQSGASFRITFPYKT